MKKLVQLVSIVLLVFACRKESPDPVYDPQPADVHIPAHVVAAVGPMQPSPGNPMTKDGVILGRKLFYEKMLSNDGSMSCASCHRQQHAFDDPRPFSEGTDGSFGDRNSMAIVNLGWDFFYFWDGRRSSLEEQAHDPVTNPVEMANSWPVVVERLQQSMEYRELFLKAFGTRKVDSNLVVRAISQFERTLVSFNSRFDRFMYEKDSGALTVSEKNGLALYTGKARCAGCHQMNPLLTNRGIRNNGIEVTESDPGRMRVTGNIADKGRFKVPTLRNIEVTAPYMHDGRFATLEEVVSFYNKGIKGINPNPNGDAPGFGSRLELTPEEQSDLVAFLKSLTDHQFLTNPEYSEP